MIIKFSGRKIIPTWDDYALCRKFNSRISQPLKDIFLNKFLVFTLFPNLNLLNLLNLFSKLIIEFESSKNEYVLF